MLVSLLSILVDSGEGRGVAGRAGGWSGEDIPRAVRCDGLDVIKKKECEKEALSVSS